MKDQISLLSGAEEVVCTMGTLSHFAMFCKPGTKFTILMHTDEFLKPQAFINKVSNIQWTLVDTSQNLFYSTFWRGVHLVGASKYWKDYVLEEWGESVEDDTLRNNCYEYIKKWCEFYNEKPHWFVDDIERNDAISMFSRIYRTVFGKEIDKNRFGLKKLNDKKNKDLRRYKNLLDWSKNF